MMDCDILLSWMTHVGDGSWTLFKNTVQELAEADVDVSQKSRALRITLSDLGFANFFVDGRQRWNVLAPVLGGLAAPRSAATLLGGRTKGLVESFAAVAAKRDCKVRMEPHQNCPLLVFAVGASCDLELSASEVGLKFVPFFASAVSRSIHPIAQLLQRAPVTKPPRNWQVRSFNFDTLTWVDGLLPNASCEYTPTYGYPTYFVHRKRGKLFGLPKRESIYAAAMMNCLPLAEYEPSTQCLSAPLHAPLPEMYSRAACLCSGKPSQISDGRILYYGVPPDLAATLMVAAGQPHPEGMKYDATTEAMA